MIVYHGSDKCIEMPRMLERSDTAGRATCDLFERSGTCRMDRIENLDFCIRYLMNQEHVEADVSSTLDDKRRLLRALMNVWQPQPLSDEFLRAQDSELQTQLNEKGGPENAGDVRKSPVLWQGDITRLQVDAIVNAANSQGLGCWHPLHGCIDNAIHSAAGLQLRRECYNILNGKKLATGDAIITHGYNLPAKYVIHTVGPIIPDGNPTKKQEQELELCYTNCLRMAIDRGCRSVAFCCISTGEFHFPNRRAAEIAVGTILKLQNSYDSLPIVVFNVFKDIDYDIYHELLNKD